MQQNRLYEESRIQQPFFKPLSNTTMDKSNSFFSFEGSHESRSRSAESIVQQNRENTFQRSNLTQDQSEGAGRLSSLHAKLHQEADKIRRWKTQTEMELKKKEQQVTEAVQMVESLRKSILELQLQNENLSLKLHDERQNQEEIVKKIDSTRNLCNLLKDHTAEVEERLGQCETERTELKYLEKTHARQFEDLSAQFKEMNISYSEEKSKLIEQVEGQKESQQKVQSELNSKLTLAETRLQQLLVDTASKDEKINMLEAELQSNQQALNKAILEIETLKESLTQTEEEFTRQSSLLQESLDDLKLTKAEKVTLESHCHEVSKALDRTEKIKEDLVCEFEAQKQSHENALLSLREEINGANHYLDDERKRLKDLRQQYEKSLVTIEDLKSSRDILIMEKSEIATHLSETTRQKSYVEEIQLTDKETLKELTQTLDEVTSELSSARDELCQLQNETALLRKNLEKTQSLEKSANETVTDLKGELNSKQETIESLKSSEISTKEHADQLSAKLLDLQSACEKHMEEMTEQNRIIKSLRDENKNQRKDIVSKEKDIAKQEKELKKYQSLAEEHTLKLEQLQKDNTELRDKLEIIEKEFEQKWEEVSSKQEIEEENAKALEEKLAQKSRSTSDLESKMKLMKTEATSKNKQIRELEKEIRSLKSQMEKATKASTSLESELKEKEVELKTVGDDHKDLSNKFEALQEQFQKDKVFVEKAEEELVKMKKETQKATNEKDTAISKCEYEMGEMMATLQKYKQDSQNIVLQKDKELETLKSTLNAKIDELNKQKEDTSASDLESELNNMKQTLKEQEKERKTLTSQSAKQDKMMDKLTKEVKTKEEEITCLKTHIEKLGKDLAKTVSENKELIKMRAKDKDELARKIEAAIPRTMSEKTPQIEVPQTPRTIKTPPSSVLKTPQRSILRQGSGSSLSKKRRVAFSTELDSHGEDSDSSSSELMEVEMTEIESRYKEKKQRSNTPIPVKPSPRVKPSPLPSEGGEGNKENITRTPLRPVPRGPSVMKKPKTPSPSKETKQFTQLYPGQPVKPLLSTRKEQLGRPTEQNHSSNLRKTPCKAATKFFKTSPKDRKRSSKLSKQENNDEVSWFDLDSVFGFGPED